MSVPLKAFLLAAAFSLPLLFSAPALAENCDACHRHALAEGKRALCVHPQTFATTIHAGLLCSDCHKGHAVFPHDRAASVRCDLPCHVAGASHAKLVESVGAGPHANLGGAGRPACLACHDSGEAKGLKGAAGEKLCAGCHEGLSDAGGSFPSDAGSFGRAAHAGLGEKKPPCAACHPAHDAKKGDGAKTCGKPGCHEGTAPEFKNLFSHKGSGTNPLSVAGLWVAVAACALFAFLGLKGSKR